MINTLLAVVAYGAIVIAIVIFLKGGDSDCNQECSQGRDCSCKD